MDLKAKESHDQLLVHLDETYNLDCRKQPSNCCCVAWIWASSSVEVKSVRQGFWLLCYKKHYINTVWEKIKTLLSENQLGNQAKVSTNIRGGDKHFICLYTHDFEDVQDVFRVLVTLQRNHLNEGSLEYLTEEGNVDEIVDGEDFERKLKPSEKSVVKTVKIYGATPISMFTYPPMMEYISMYKHNIGPESKIGLVAQLRKISLKYRKEKIVFYDPPKIQPSYSSQSRPCKYDELVDSEDNFHEPDCDKKPSVCYCEFVLSWINVSKPVRVKSIHSGSWLLFPEKEEVDEVWEKVKILLAANRLGNGAQVSKTKRRKDGWDDHVICVFVSNSEDVQDVFRVLVTLRRNRLQDDTFINYEVDDDKTLQKIFKIEAQSADFSSASEFEDGRNFFLYFSPPNPTNNDPTGEGEIIQLFKNNIESGFKRGLVTLIAELKKERHDFEAKIDFYNPPRILHPTDRSLGFIRQLPY